MEYNITTVLCVVWAYMTSLVIMMKYEKTVDVDKRYGRLALILIDKTRKPLVTFR